MEAPAADPVRLIIAGLPRCGTTLLATLLNQQPSCRFVTDYANWFRHARERLEVDWDTPLTLAQRRVCLALARDEWLRYRHPVLVATGDFSTLDGLHLAIARELQGASVAVGHKALLDPTQMEAARSRTAIQLIVVARDPRAAALSYWHRVGAGIESYVDDWRRSVRYALEGGRGITFVRFEDLIEAPRDTLGRLTQLFGGEPVLPPTLRFDGATFSTEWSENSAFGDVKEAFDRTPLERWREHQASPIVRYADAICRAEMERLGYPALEEHGQRSRLRMRFHEAYWKADRQIERTSRDVRARLRKRLTRPLAHR